MNVASLEVMREALTGPYQRGMQTLELALGAADTAGVVPVAAYDFAAYSSLYDGLPESPGYVLIPHVALAEAAAVRVLYRTAPNAAQDSAVVTIPAGTTAGLSFAIAVPATAGAALRLVGLQPLIGDVPSGPPSAVWRVVALLGNLAKLLWVIGREHEVLTAQIADVRAQRSRAGAHGVSLDLLGSDLGVPRFPPSAYSFEPDTIALYHLDDEPGGAAAEVATVRDQRERHAPGKGHDAQNGDPPGGVGRAASRAPGRFARAFAFGFGAAGSVLLIPSHPDFALPVSPAQDFTAEAMIRPDPGIGAGAVLAKREVLNDSSKPGWSLTVGSFRGLRANLRLSASDGTRQAELFADVDLADGTYHHVAAVLERRSPGAMLRLVVDGRERAQERMPALGDLSNGQPVRIGRGTERDAGGATSPAQYVGLVDEVRFSRVARASFHPVLGEGDEQYRARLGIFERWVVPTPQAIEDAINELVHIDGQARSFRVIEDDDDVALATEPLRVVPRELLRGDCIAADGSMRRIPDALGGTVEDEPDFEPAWLVRHVDPRLDFGGVEARRLMHAAASEALGRLAELVFGSLGRIEVSRAYDPAGPGLHCVGRALLLKFAGELSSSDLAFLAHQAGFDLVCIADEGVQATVAPSETLRIDVVGGSQAELPPGVDVLEGGGLTLWLRQAPPLDSEVRWLVVRCGEGDATLRVPRWPAGGVPEVVVAATRAGRLSVRVEVTGRRRRAAGTLDLRVGIQRTGPGSLAAGESISRSGRRGAPEGDATAGPAAPFHPAYLAFSDVAGVDYGTDPLHRRMQRVTADALERLAALRAVVSISVDRAYSPNATDLHGLGRALRLTGAGIPAGSLAALCHAVGFDYVRCETDSVVYVASAPGELIDIESPVGGGGGIPVGLGVTMRVAPRAGPSALAFLPDGSGAVVAGRDNDVLSLVRLEGRAGRMPAASVADAGLVAHRPTGVAVSPDGRRAFVAHEGSDRIAVLDLPSLQAAADVAPLPKPRAVAIVPDGTRLCVACAGDATIRTYDTATLGPVGPAVTLPGSPVALAIAPNGQQAWVVSDRVDQLTVIDLGSNAISQVALPGPSSSIAIAPDGITAYAAVPDAGRVVAITVATRTISAQVDVPGDPAALALTADGAQLWIACTVAGQLRVMSTARNVLDPAIVPLAREPVALAASPPGTTYRPTVLAVARAGSDVTLLDPAAVAAQGRTSPIASTLVLGSGLGERLSWATIPAPRGQASLSSSVAQTVTVRGSEPGELLVRALYSRPGRTRPYEFELRLVPALEQPSTVVRKDQYDIVMNVLNSLHPIGVEVRTQHVRQHVVEIAEGIAEALPGYTFPPFRTNGPPRPATRKERT